MRHTILKAFVLSSILLTGVTSCSNDDSSSESTIQGDNNNGTKSLSAKSNQTSFTSQASTSEIIIETNEDSWAISSSDKTWLQLSQESGSSGKTTIKITVLENKNTTSRSATVTAISKNAKAEVTFTQQGK
ncbi:BACON domain-containing protein [Flavobacterium polysaccharolyticum]|uniref:BACON domain-containing protein n=1 Tax=Flavobacterium polysaccharolyticum TaxID=3133148 RepID=A0ABU9NVF7_9FLAO